MPDNPYKHFNDFKSPCYMRLWELEGGDGDQAEVGIGFAGGGNWEEDDSDDDSSDSFDSEDEEDFAAFGPDEDFIHFSDDDDDTSDDEPAPDQRQDRDVRIELVNFARAGGAANAQIIQDARRGPAAAPPAAPAPPRRGRRGNRQQARRAQPPAGQANLPRAGNHNGGARDLRAQVEAAAHERQEDQGRIEVEEERIRVGPAPGQGRNAAQQPAPLRGMGLERFLELAQRDQEDEWDSDELDE